MKGPAREVVVLFALQTEIKQELPFQELHYQEWKPEIL